MDRHTFTYEQYCTIVGKNIILQETAYHDGTRKISCLNLPLCREAEGCKNKYVLRRIENAESERRSTKKE